jgi:hypothetical protein
MSVIIGAMMLMWIALVNGQPFFLFGDTATYVREADAAVVWAFGPRFATPWTTSDVIRAFDRGFDTSPIATKPQLNEPLRPDWDVLPQRRAGHVISLQDGIVLAGRSFYYGVLLYIGELAGGFWLSVLGQALVVAYVIFILAVRCYGLSLAAFLILIGTLALISTAPFFVGLLMPDIFAGVTILVTAILIAFWGNLKRYERIVLALILTFAVMTHPTHLMVCVVMLGIYVIANALRGFSFQRFRVGAVVVISACVAAGILAELSFNFFVAKVIGVPPIRPPFIMARLIEMGPGYEYLKTHCSDPVFTVCRFLDQLPQRTETFLWSSGASVGVFPLASPETKRALGEEQYAFAIRVLMFDPVGVTVSLLRYGLHQLGTFGLAEFYYCDECATEIRDSLPAEHWSRMQHAVAFHHSWPSRAFTIVDHFFVILSLMLLTAVAAFHFNRGVDRRALQVEACRLLPGWFFVAVAVGIGANALICGGFSVVHDRYQARVIWLLPLVALLLLARFVQYGSAWPNPRSESSSTRDIKVKDRRVIITHSGKVRTRKQ